MFAAVFIEQRGWRIQFDGIDTCGAINEQVARETAALMQMSRITHYGKPV